MDARAIARRNSSHAIDANSTIMRRCDDWSGRRRYRGD
jgi:hypothetical protein